jgi:hypothetical protein
MDKPVQTSPDFAQVSADRETPRSSTRVKIGWTSLVLLPTLASLWLAGHRLGLLDDWGRSLTGLVMSSATGGNTDETAARVSLFRNARQASHFPEPGPAYSKAQPDVETPAEVPPGPTDKGSERIRVERLMKLLEQNDATWAAGYKAEQQRADDIARDLAAVRAELADHVAAETSARAEVARMAKLLEANKTESTKDPEAEGERTARVAKKLATHTELADRPTIEASAQTTDDLIPNIKTGSVGGDRLKTEARPKPSRTTVDRGDGPVALAVNAERAHLPKLIPQDWVQVYADRKTKTRRFVSSDGQSAMISNESLAHASIQKDMDRIAYHVGEQVTYQRRGNNWIAVSGYKGDRIFYRKSNLACHGTRWHTIELEYPIEAKRRMDAPVTQIAHDMGRYREDCGK